MLEIDAQNIIKHIKNPFRQFSIQGLSELMAKVKTRGGQNNHKF